MGDQEERRELAPCGRAAAGRTLPGCWQRRRDRCDQALAGSQARGPVGLDAGEQELLDQVIGYYHETLLQSPEAMAYLERRGIASRELIETQRLGFANRALGLRLPVTRVKAGAELRTRLQRTGVLRESGHEHFNGCLVVPVVDEAGHVTEVYGHKITEGANPPLHLYLPGPHRGVWNARALMGQGEVILTEALIDAMTFWCAGYRNLTAAYGVEGLTDDHLAAFRRCGVRRVLIAFARDDAGERGADKAAERLMGEGVKGWSATASSSPRAWTQRVRAQGDACDQVSRAADPQGSVARQRCCAERSSRPAGRRCGVACRGCISARAPSLAAAVLLFLPLRL